MAGRRDGQGGAAEGQEPLTRKDLLFFFWLPFTGIIILVFLASTLNRASIQRGAERLAREQLAAASEILKAGISHAIEDGELPSRILASYDGDKNIYYMALLDDTGAILDWRSQFEGYLPLSLQEAPKEGSWIIDSPAGRIFNSFSTFSPGGGKRHALYLGYSLETLDTMLAGNLRSALVVFGIIAALGLILIRGIVLLQSGYLAREREAEEALAEKIRYQEISAFTSGIAHEIKNPLNRLQLLFGHLEAGGPPGLQEKIGLGKEEVGRIATTIDRFSDALRPIHIHPSVLPVGPVIDSILSSIGAEIPAARERTHIDVPRGLNMKVDGHLLTLALANVLRNAYEASDSREVFISGEKVKRGIRLTIRDSGPGIPPDAIGRIFEPFFTTKARGTGIGLYLARKIIEAHGGKIEARAGEAGGAVFLIHVPGE